MINKRKRSNSRSSSNSEVRMRRLENKLHTTKEALKNAIVKLKNESLEPKLKSIIENNKQQHIQNILDIQEEINNLKKKRGKYETSDLDDVMRLMTIK